MPKSITHVLGVATMCLLLNGCAAVVVGGVAAGAATGAAVGSDPRSSGGVFDDQELKQHVANSLDAAIPGHNVEVTSYNQKILLTGQVISPENKTKAEAIARQVAGVKKVFNYIEVGPTETAAQVSRDAYLTSLIKSNMLFSKGISSNDVKVVTSHQVVYLMGLVDDYQAKKMIHAASEIDGVRDVINLFDYTHSNN
jgi:osmotically-inducible protein OsmY